MLVNPVSITAQVVRSACPSETGQPAKPESLNLALQIAHVVENVISFSFFFYHILKLFCTQDAELNEEIKDSLSVQQVAIVSKHWHLGRTVIAPKGSNFLIGKALLNSNSYNISRLQTET
jgi:hypothetical protein